jgi:predicted RNA binding protein YcfA (HicA-like mRNA interferase family)
MSQDEKLFSKLLNGTILKRELETLLSRLGFEKLRGKGSHEVWGKKGVADAIVLASHHKEVKRYQIKQVIEVLRKGGLL